MANAHYSILADFDFWTVVIAGIALILSQLPPLKTLCSPKRIDVDVHNRIQINHKVGNPNVGMFLSIRNSGPRQLLIKSIYVSIMRDNNPVASLPAQNYFEKPASNTAIIFIPFLLKPGETWAHPINFLNFFDRSTEKIYRKSQSDLDADIRKKLAKKTETDNEPVSAENEFVAPFMKLFSHMFIWSPGEYIVNLKIETDSKSPAFNKKYRFTLYESDTAELMSYTNDYKNGFGVSFNTDNHSGLFVPISQHSEIIID